MRKYLTIAGSIAAVLMFAVTATAAGPDSGWGKGLLSETLLFYEDAAEVPGGYMYWNSALPEFVYDFHGYYLETGVVYYLICYEDADDDGPDDFTELGSANVCDYLGVHIKGIMDWLSMDDATISLVPGTWSGLGGSEDWSPETYLISEVTVDLTG